MIKAIETRYKGYRFRSRLEARWAVFFDALGVKWEYEPEGFDLGEHGAYLPDFWLPGFRCYVEIKPEIEWDVFRGHYAPRLWAKYRAFSNDVGPILVFGGLPSMAWSGTVFCHEGTDSGGGEYSNRVGWARCDVCNQPVISFSDGDKPLMYGHRELLMDVTMVISWTEAMHKCKRNGKRVETVFDLVQEACGKATSARFEHGERP